ncbi:MAG: protease complex subunit PrcB family protein [Desulfobacterales bacterium]|nr:protease complex subunit PrcB family protein [Desulfobacterales bacterium]
MKRKGIWSIAAAVLFTATGCLHSASAEKGATTNISTNVVYTGGQCGSSEACGEWINDAEHLESVCRKVRREFIAGSDIPVPAIDFEQFAALRISMGTQPTGGYELVLVDTHARIEKETAIIRVDWIEPAPDAMVTQMITSPCLLVRIPRGDYRRIEIQDQHGTVRCRIDVH